jgi:HEAT repeat protein
MRPKGKRIAFAVTTLGIATLAIAGFLLRGPILERWYLHKFEAGTSEEQENAIKKLGDVGSEFGLIRLHKQFLQWFFPNKLQVGCNRGPYLLQRMRWLAKVGYSNQQDGDEKIKTLFNRLKAIAQIAQRLGGEREIAAYMKIINNEAADSSMRIYLSAQVIFATGHPRSAEEIPDSIINWSRFAEERTAALKVTVPFLSGEDVLLRRAVLSILGWCGSEAAAAIPDLEKCAQDPQPGIRQAATEALKRIRGE